MSKINKTVSSWDDRYADDDYLFGTEPNGFLSLVANTIPANSRVLCLADGEGRNGVYLASLGHKVTSIDLSQVGLNKATQLAEKNQVDIETIQADLSTHDLGIESWDCIVSIFFHIPPALQATIYPRIIEALKPGGRLILESYTPDQLQFGTGGPPIASLMLTREIVETAFAALSFDHLQELERDVTEGLGHTGRAAVLQLLATRPV